MPFYDAIPSGPAVHAEAITISDTTTYTPPFRGVYVGGTGDLAVVMTDGSSATFSAVPAGSLLPICVTKIMSAGTSATLIVGVR